MTYLETDYGKIRIIDIKQVEDAVCALFIKANHTPPADVAESIASGAKRETSPVGRVVLNRLSDNLKAAAELDIPICQDTGMAIVFAEVGCDVHLIGGTLEEAVNRGVARAYLEGGMRCSIVSDPLYSRKNSGDNTPAILYIKHIKGDQIRLIAAPKGFGSENMSAIKMFTPSAGEEDIARFVVDTVCRAGSNPCPPIAVGIGIGGDFEYSAYLAKYALLRPLNERNRDKRYAALEEKILREINKTGIGPQGFGGDITALSVSIEEAPTHIAGLPVSVNINCHVIRHAEALI